MMYGELNALRGEISALRGEVTGLRTEIIELRDQNCAASSTDDGEESSISKAETTAKLSKGKVPKVTSAIDSLNVTVTISNPLICRSVLHNLVCRSFFSSFR